MFFKMLVAPAVACAVALVAFPTAAFSDACDSAIAASNRHAEKGMADVDRVVARVDKAKTAEEVEGIMCDMMRATLDFWIAALPLKQHAESACGSRLRTQCRSGCVQSNIAKARADVVKQCSPKPARRAERQPAQCTTPPAPSATRTSPTNMCFKAKNTNSDSRCVYSFTYRVSNRPNALSGGSVEPGKTEERCSLQSGVNISFEKWTKVQSSAR